jgi:hypothetical protein
MRVSVTSFPINCTGIEFHSPVLPKFCCIAPARSSYESAQFFFFKM